MAGFIIAYSICTALGAGTLYIFEPRFKTMNFWLSLPLAFGTGAALLVVIHQILLLILR